MRWVYLAVIVLLVNGCAASVPVSELVPGDRVRTSGADAGVARGEYRVLAVSDVALTLRVQSDSVRAPLTSLQWMRVRRDVRHTASWAVLAGLVGAMIGASIDAGCSTAECESDSPNGSSMGVGAATGATIGAALGYVIRTPGWVNVRVR